MPSFKWDSPRPEEEALTELIAPGLLKLAWFAEQGYYPHLYQLFFHNFRNEDGELCRFRHLVAGRRGGKTLSAAWEVLYYSTHPEAFHRDAYGKEDTRPLHIWVLAKDHTLGRAALLAFREVIRQAGLRKGIDYNENRGEKYFEFPDGTLIEFRTADDPESLRGAGLDILWIDEAAAIPSNQAYYVVYPALSDKLGRLITTTTPKGKNWYYDEFWNDKALSDPDQGIVEYRSIDNPYFQRKEWERVKRRYHPLLFKQEYMASFDSMAGVELSGDWLHFYETKEIPRNKDGKLELQVFIGVDPAISLSDQADYFVLTVIGVTKDNSTVYLLEQIKKRIPFAEQVNLIELMQAQWRPTLIGVETTAYQAALAQQLERLPSLPPIYEVPARGKKSQRILAMSPLFRLGRVRVRRDHRDFIDEWVDYDSTLKNPKDDCLDSMEIALRTAGALLPEMPDEEDVRDRPAKDIDELADRRLPKQLPEKFEEDIYWDDELGSDF